MYMKVLGRPQPIFFFDFPTFTMRSIRGNLWKINRILVDSKIYRLLFYRNHRMFWFVECVLFGVLLLVTLEVTGVSQPQRVANHIVFTQWPVSDSKRVSGNRPARDLRRLWACERCRKTDEWSSYDPVLTLMKWM